MVDRVQVRVRVRGREEMAWKMKCLEQHKDFVEFYCGRGGGGHLLEGSFEARSDHYRLIIRESLLLLLLFKVYPCVLITFPKHTKLM